MTEVRQLTFDEARDCYMQALRNLGLTALPQMVPVDTALQVAAECARVQCLKFCEVNNLQLPE